MTNLWYSYHTYIAPYNQHRRVLSPRDSESVSQFTNIQKSIDVGCGFNSGVCHSVRSKFNILSSVKSAIAGLFAK